MKVFEVHEHTNGIDFYYGSYVTYEEALAAKTELEFDTELNDNFVVEEHEVEEEICAGGAE